MRSNKDDNEPMYEEKEWQITLSRLLEDHQISDRVSLRAKLFSFFYSSLFFFSFSLDASTYKKKKSWLCRLSLCNQVLLQNYAKSEFLLQTSLTFFHFFFFSWPQLVEEASYLPNLLFSYYVCQTFFHLFLNNDYER